MPPETVISTIRHAYTEYNAQRRYAGSLDIPLSDAGRLEAQKAALKLARTHFDFVITSPLVRARETAEIFAGSRLPVVTNPLCTERNFGVMEGLTWDEIRRLQPAVLLIQVGYDLHTVNPKGGEPFEDVWQRAKGFRDFLFREYAGLNSLIVSHGVFLQLFNGLLRGWNCIESLAVYPANLELNRFKLDGDRLVEETVLRLGTEEVVSW